MRANLRICASCEWVFKYSHHRSCPKCGFAHYSARYVCGDKCYRFQKIQGPWLRKRLAMTQRELEAEIRQYGNKYNAAQQVDILD